VLEYFGGQRDEGPEAFRDFRLVRNSFGAHYLLEDFLFSKTENQSVNLETRN
jgi:hypothetical protein